MRLLSYFCFLKRIAMRVCGVSGTLKAFKVIRIKLSERIYKCEFKKIKEKILGKSIVYGVLSVKIIYKEFY